MFLSLLLPPTLAQSNQNKPVPPEARKTIVASDPDLGETERRDFAISVLISLAKEATSFNDLALRPRVLARAADILWDADNINARAIFLRAWEAAEKADADEVTIKTKDAPPPMVIALRRSSGRDLRSEVLALVARRDRTLADEFLTKLKNETDREAKDSKRSRPPDNGSASEADAKRLEVARQLLNEGLVQQALEIALPALLYVNAKSIIFLSALRAKDAEAADQRFSYLLSRTALDPSSDANTVSGLSSYVFTPGFYITFSGGGPTWTQSEQAIEPPNLPANLRDNFFRVAANILMRPLPPPDRDLSSSGRAGTIMVIRRLLPVFEQNVPDTATALRSYLTQLTGNSSDDPRRGDNSLLTQGIKEDEPGDILKGLQNKIDYAKTSRERDEIYAAAAVILATRADERARDLADKIDDAERKSEVRQFVDFQFVQLAIKKKESSQAVRLAERGQLTHSQRAFAYTQAARLLKSSERERCLELLEKATDEAMRIESPGVDRAVLLIGIATQMTMSDSSRAWDIMNNAAKAANASEDFNGENWIRFSMVTRNGVKTNGIGGEEFSLFRVFQLLSKNDLYRSIDLAKSFKNEATQADSILGITSAILQKQAN